jgi:NitT/TauT family transport system substrate-binding protein
MRTNQWIIGVLGLCLGFMRMAAAEVGEVRLATAHGIGYLPLIVMEHHKLFEKHAKVAGLGEVKLTRATIGLGTAIQDALLSGSVHFASGGVPPFVTQWSRTIGNLDIKAVGALSSMPQFLNTRNPNVKTIRDFTEKDRIALAGVKSSIHAITLQMAAEQVFGAGNQFKLDALTVAFSHPDGMAALLSGTEITSHFTSPPFQYQELDKPGIRTVLNSYDVLGGPATFLMVWTSGKFVEANPRTYAAFVAALDEAMRLINGNKRAAIEAYLAVTKEKSTVEDLLKIVNDPQNIYTLTPQNTMKYVDFMYKVGTIKVKPASWKEMFFPNVHNLPGS